MKIEDIILERLTTLEAKMDLTREDIAGLKVKSGVWGFVAGLIPPTIGMVMWILTVAVK